MMSASDQTVAIARNAQDCVFVGCSVKVFAANSMTNSLVKFCIKLAKTPEGTRPKH